MTKLEREICERLQKDEENGRGSLLSINESYVILLALRRLENYETNYAKLLHKSDINEAALEIMSYKVDLIDMRKPICDAMREIVDDAKKQAEELFRSTPNAKNQDAFSPARCEEENGKFFVYRLDLNGQYVLDMVCDTEEDAVNRVYEIR